MDLYNKLTANMEALSANFQSRMHQYEESLQRLASPDSAQHKDLASLSKDFLEFKSVMWKTVTLLKSQAELIIQGIDRQETISRRKVLLLHGVPEVADETPSQSAVDVLVKQLQMADVNCEDIATCHRLGTRTSKPRPLLIRFSRYTVRSTAWSAKTLLKGSGITMSEFLTKARHDVFMAARKHFGIQQCWTSEGKINIQLPDKSRRKIETPPELTALMQRYSVPVRGSSSTAPARDPKDRTPPVPTLKAKAPATRGALKKQLGGAK